MLIRPDPELAQRLRQAPDLFGKAPTGEALGRRGMMTGSDGRCARVATQAAFSVIQAKTREEPRVLATTADTRRIDRLVVSDHGPFEKEPPKGLGVRDREAIECPIVVESPIRARLAKIDEVTQLRAVNIVLQWAKEYGIE